MLCTYLIAHLESTVGCQVAMLCCAMLFFMLRHAALCCGSDKFFP